MPHRLCAAAAPYTAQIHDAGTDYAIHEAIIVASTPISSMSWRTLTRAACTPPTQLFRSSPKPDDRKTVSSKQTIIPEPAFNIPIVLAGMCAHVCLPPRTVSQQRCLACRHTRASLHWQRCLACWVSFWVCKRPACALFLTMRRSRCAYNDGLFVGGKPNSSFHQVKVGEQLDESGPNAFVGGKNRWTYDSFVNWEFWWPGFPVLVYFKV